MRDTDPQDPHEARRRLTRYLPHRAAANLSRAITFATERGTPLNHMVTLNYGLTHGTEEAMTRAFRRLLKSFFVKWFTRHRVMSDVLDRSAPYVWVAEGRPGHHGIHWLVHIPPGMFADFDERLPRWLDRTVGPVLAPTAIHVAPAFNPRGAGDYMLKGLAPGHARRFRVKHSFQGDVYGKRCGVSENLGPTAIRRRRASVAAGLRIAD
jgi:hypothetical protein